MSIPVNKLDKYIWEIPKTFNPNMRVPGRIYADEEILAKMRVDRTLMQCTDVAQLPGILKYSITLPDGHQGYGFPIGGVAAFDMDTGIVTPGGVGYDINCGVLLLRTDLTYNDVRPRVQDLIDRIFNTVPSGVGRGGALRVTTSELDRATVEGLEWAIKRGYGWEEDRRHIEDEGCMEGANPDKVSVKAKQRGLSQLGTLGAGNHFLEIGRVAEIYDEKVAKAFGITGVDQIIAWVHTGSRGYGHQVASDYIRVMDHAMAKYNLRTPDRELGYAPIKSREGEDYLEAMACAMNYGFLNRHIIMHLVRQSFEKTLGRSADAMGMRLVYGMTHNTAKIEEHMIDGKRIKTLVHRKGASRAFGPGRPELPEDYRSIGQPVLLVGTMGTASYILVGTEKGEEISFASTAHGAGRVLSRAGAKRQFNMNEVVNELKKRGIILRAASREGVEEEVPESYKDIHRVAKVSDEVGIGKKVVMAKPIAVTKG
jgi:tRNA-splicing ligase RtcB